MDVDAVDTPTEVNVHVSLFRLLFEFSNPQLEAGELELARWRLVEALDRHHRRSCSRGEIDATQDIALQHLRAASTEMSTGAHVDLVHELLVLHTLRCERSDLGAGRVELQSDRLVAGRTPSHPACGAQP